MAKADDHGTTAPAKGEWVDAEDLGSPAELDSDLPDDLEQGESGLDSEPSAAEDLGPIPLVDDSDSDDVSSRRVLLSDGAVGWTLLGVAAAVVVVTLVWLRISDARELDLWRALPETSSSAEESASQAPQGSMASPLFRLLMGTPQWQEAPEANVWLLVVEAVHRGDRAGAFNSVTCAPQTCTLPRVRTFLPGDRYNFTIEDPLVVLQGPLPGSRSQGDGLIVRFGTDDGGRLDLMVPWPDTE